MKVVLSYGLGVDSTSLLLRWLEDPSSRDFALSDLLVVTAMTGDEWPRTGYLVEQHVLPRLAAEGVRFVQIARRSRRQADGITVLSDTDMPDRLHLAGDYRLSDELTAAGTIPQAGGARRCSMKFKGWVVSTYLEQHAPEAFQRAFARDGGGEPGRMVFGFETGETARASRARTYDTPRLRSEFPLIDWGWDRADCERYIAEVTSVSDWPKSACVYCPFSLTSKAGRARTLTRYDTRPDSAIEALMLERRSLALNPRGGLIAGDRLADLIAQERPAIASAFAAAVDDAPHALYEVRRIWRPRADDPERVANVNRSLRVLRSGSRADCERALLDLADPGELVVGEDGLARLYRRRRGAELPAREHFLVVGPAGAEDRQMPNFERWWAQATPALQAAA